MYCIGEMVRDNMLEAQALFKKKVGEDKEYAFKNEDNTPFVLIETRSYGIVDVAVEKVRMNRKGRFDFLVTFPSYDGDEDTQEWVDEINCSAYTPNEVYEVLHKEIG